MNKQEILNTILNDDIAKNFAMSGNDLECAKRLSDILPLIRVTTILTDRGLYKNLGAVMAEEILTKLENYNGQYKKVIKRILGWLEPTNQGFDFGDQESLNFIRILQSENVLSSNEVDAIDSLSLAKQEISTDLISDVLFSIRYDGRLTPQLPLEDPEIPQEQI